MNNEEKMYYLYEYNQKTDEKRYIALGIDGLYFSKSQIKPMSYIEVKNIVKLQKYSHSLAELSYINHGIEEVQGVTPTPPKEHYKVAIYNTDTHYKQYLLNHTANEPWLFTKEEAEREVKLYKDAYNQCNVGYLVPMMELVDTE